MTIAIIGAGMAGLACAEALLVAGRQVALFDKGRGPGGRMSTRRAQTPMGEARFDHGAQYFTASGEAFAAQVAAWHAARVVAPWTGHLVDCSGARDPSPMPEKARYVGTPSMNALIRHMAGGCDVTWGARVASLSGGPGDWTVAFEDGATPVHASHIGIAVPAEQVSPLLSPVAPSLARAAEAVRSDPSWTVMAAFDAPLPVRFDGAASPTESIGWAARNGAKPGRSEIETWVLQATPDWSRAHLEDDAKTVAQALMDEFRATHGGPSPVHMSAHRWRFAQIAIPTGAGAQYDRDLQVGTCGDWHLGRNVEHAWQSGRQLADMIIEAES